MPYEVKILCDSINYHNKRLTTFEFTYPRFVHSEFMTHRMFSRNSASSRAIPVEKLIQRVMEDPVIPVSWGKNQKGMQAEEELDQEAQSRAEYNWLSARNIAVAKARSLMDLGVHKQIANRIIEPWMFITVIATATDLGNFFNLRYHKDAQPEIRKLAVMMVEAYDASTPNLLNHEDWHLPLIGFPGDEELTLEEKKKVSVGRCARVSYLTHNGIRDISADLELFERLKESGHWSPFEHVAQNMSSRNYYGNFCGWKQYRREFRKNNRKRYEYNGKILCE